MSLVSCPPTATSFPLTAAIQVDWYTGTSVILCHTALPLYLSILKVGVVFHHLFPWLILLWVQGWLCVLLNLLTQLHVYNIIIICNSYCCCSTCLCRVLLVCWISVITCSYSSSCWFILYSLNLLYTLCTLQLQSPWDQPGSLWGNPRNLATLNTHEY